MNRVCALSAGTSQTADCPFPYLDEHAVRRYWTGLARMGNRRKYRRELHVGDLGKIFHRLSRAVSCNPGPLLVNRSLVTLRLIICIWLDLMGVGLGPRTRMVRLITRVSYVV